MLGTIQQKKLRRPAGAHDMQRFAQSDSTFIGGGWLTQAADRGRSSHM